MQQVFHVYLNDTALCHPHHKEINKYNITGLHFTNRVKK